MVSIIANEWQDYSLIDFGNGEKLERFGDLILIRPEISAEGKPNQSKSDWLAQAHVEFKPSGKLSGMWKPFKQLTQPWRINYDLGIRSMRFQLELTRFKHVGLFPEQSTNWQFIFDQVSQREAAAKVLNLFSYTGASSLAARAGGGEVTHVESLRQLVSWAKLNMDLSEMQDIRWTVEDAFKFAKRELKRGKSYDGIIMDPPAWGRGPRGEMWKLEDQFEELLQTCSQLLTEGGFLVVNTYSGISPAKLSEMITSHFQLQKIENGALCLKSESGALLETGSLLRGVALE